MSGPFFMEDAPARPVAPTYPEVPGFKKRETSKAAAASMEKAAPTLRERVLAEIKRKPSTPDEVAKRLRETVLAIRPRVTELAKTNQVVDSGERRENASGRKAIVWRCV